MNRAGPAAPRVRLIGLPTDAHSSFLRGAALGPAAIRAALASDHGNQAAEDGVEPGGDVAVEDGGDLALSGTAENLPVIEPLAPRDLDGITASLAARLARELASLVPGARP